MTFVQRGPCSYLPDRTWALAMRAAPADDAGYRALLETSHRRSGFIVYRPVCQACAACQPLRVPVDGFRRTRSQRRAQRRNADVTLELGPLEPTAEKAELLHRFTRGRFRPDEQAEPEPSSPDERLARYTESFGRSPVTTREMRYRVGERLVGLGIVDLLPDVVSSVYFCFDPAESRRSLGVHSGLCEVELARATGRRYWYLGYYIAGCRTMRYKARFGPCEVLGPDGWIPFTPPPGDEDGGEDEGGGEGREGGGEGREGDDVDG